jgi:hypothetical protein
MGTVDDHMTSCTNVASLLPTVRFVYFDMRDCLAINYVGQNHDVNQQQPGAV